MPQPVFEYVDLQTVLAALQPPGPNPNLAVSEAAQARIRRTIRAASVRINVHCHRVFTPTVMTRTFDAPIPSVLISPLATVSGQGVFNPFLSSVLRSYPTALLPVLDLQSVSSLSAFGVTLGSDDYQILRYQLDTGQPDTAYLLRQVAGIPVSWYYGGVAPLQPLDAIHLVGTFCYDLTDDGEAAIPDGIVEVAEALVLKTWQRAIRQYGSVQGALTQAHTFADNTTLDDDLKSKLDDYKADIAAEYAV